MTKSCTAILPHPTWDQWCPIFSVTLHLRIASFIHVRGKEALAKNNIRKW